MKKYIGLDLGSSSMKAVVLDENREMQFKTRITHHGKTAETLKKLMKELEALQLQADSKVVITGVNGSLLVRQEYIAGDIPAIEKGSRFLYPKAEAVLEIGSQNARYLTELGGKTPPSFAVNESCAGGTGSFFEDQMYRLGLQIEHYSTLCAQAESVPRLSGRCSVFAKTDIIHRQQEGVDTPDILLGLCYATIRNLKATVIRNLPINKPMAFCGGVLYNEGVKKAIRDIFQLSGSELLADETGVYAQAIGAAVMAMEGTLALSWNMCVDNAEHAKADISGIVRLEPLELEDLSVTKDPVCVPVKEGHKVSLGIDVGSTSTNLVLVDETGDLVDFQYLRTRGEPEEVVKKGLNNILERFGNKIQITSAGVTGSGRYLIGNMIGADSVKDEITAQAKAAFLADDNTDTVFEIGGQDSKYIQIAAGGVKDFQMNKICAAGTGSFLEEQANRLQVPVEEYGELALAAKNPVDLGERCTVFIESNISACQSKGVETPDILAGLCHSVIHNYLYKVVGNKPVGKHIMLQGGVCYNAGVVAAFRAVYGDRVKVSSYFSISGAYGVARIAAEETGKNHSNFRGLRLDRAGNETGSLQSVIKENEDYYNKAKEYFFDGYVRTLDPEKKTVGIPYVLLVHKLFPMFRAFFENLGYNCLLSQETNEDIIEIAQKYAQAETCYPVKLIYGHMAWLADQKVDYIFLPSVLTMKHEKSKVYRNYGCIYMQSAPQMIFENMKLAEQGITLLNPRFSLDFGQKAMAGCMISAGVSLGKSKPACTAALLRGAMAVRKHTEQVEMLGEELLSGLKPDEKVLVMVTRTYGIEDPVLNMEIPQELLKRGYKVITISHLPSHDVDISAEYENLYWPFGQHIISSAKMIAKHPNLFAVYLTNHGCGPDTMLTHLFQKEMGDKPYLNIEVDEHFSKVGAITRIEAFLNSIAQHKIQSTPVNMRELKHLTIGKAAIPKSISRNKKIYLPYLYPYTQIISWILNNKGYEMEVLPQSDEITLSRGQTRAMSKEYLSFTSLVGSILVKNQADIEAQFLIPQTEGSETDGLYARVIYDLLGREGSVAAPMVETLPFEFKEFEPVFLGILGGDLVLTAPVREREMLMNRIQAMQEISMEKLKELALQISVNRKKQIAVIGDPYLVYHPFLHGYLLEDLEKSGEQLQWMPLGEYLCFLWNKRAASAKEKKVVSRYQKQIQELSKSMGIISPYADGLKEIFDAASGCLSQVSGGNISYRYGKQYCLNHAKAVIHISSTYENAQTIMNLFEKKSNLPAISLSFEGTNQESIREKLQSFVYYLK